MGKDLEETLNEVTFWHFRYQQQATWTCETRRYLFNQAGVDPDDRILDIGCGSGAIMEALTDEGFTDLTGIDIDPTILSTLHRPFPVSCADGMELPFSVNTFDHAFCHFTLMWSTDPQQMVCEMYRVTRSGGWIFLLAEPDYGGRLSYPQELEKLADLQTEALHRQGANTKMGRELLTLLSACGLQNASGGIIGSETHQGSSNPLSIDLEVLRRDLEGILAAEEAERILRKARTSAYSPGASWYVPVCYACGQVP